VSDPGGRSQGVDIDGSEADRPTTPGIHHVSTVAGDPFGNRRFYSDLLGMRLTKRTVNFDEPYVYHLYYGDSAGSPGTTLTCFPYPLDDGGRVGTGQPTEVALAVPTGGLTAWADRLASEGVDAKRDERFGEQTLQFTDPDGLPLALVESEAAGVVSLDERPVEPWTGGELPVESGRAIRGIHSVTLDSANPFVTARVLEVLGFGLVGQSSDRVRYVAGQPISSHADLTAYPVEDRPAVPRPGTVVDVLDRDSEWGKEGAGTGHHVAFRVPDRESLDTWYDRLVDAGLSPSRPKDRHYFQSVYVRDPGGILFELATDGPGLTRDESVADLGSDLHLPPWFAADEAMIRAQLPPLDRPVERGDVAPEARR
jgi:glyoxalase family protein